jgi:hypothetical protein
LPSVCLGVFFSPTLQSLDFLVWHCLLIWLALVMFESWQRLSCWELSSDPYSFQFLTHPSVSLLFPTRLRNWDQNNSWCFSNKKIRRMLFWRTHRHVKLFCTTKFWSWSTGTHEGCQSTSSQSTSITARCHSSSHCGVHFCGNLSNGFDRSKHFSENSWGTPAATTSHSKTSAHIAFAFTQSVFDPSQSAFALLSTQFQLRAGFLAQPPMPIVRCCTRNTC